MTQQTLFPTTSTSQFAFFGTANTRLNNYTLFFQCAGAGKATLEFKQNGIMQFSDSFDWTSSGTKQTGNLGAFFGVYEVYLTINYVHGSGNVSVYCTYDQSIGIGVTSVVGLEGDVTGTNIVADSVVASTFEHSLGNPSITGQVLASTSAGARSWANIATPVSSIPSTGVAGQQVYVTIYTDSLLSWDSSQNKWTGKLGTSFANFAAIQSVTTTYLAYGVTAGTVDGHKYEYTAFGWIEKLGLSADGKYLAVAKPLTGPAVRLNLMQFGAVGDGVTDDTASVQAFVNYLCANHVYGLAPAGMYKLTSTINFPCTYGWGIIGDGPEATVFNMFTDNIAIFNLGATALSYMHSYALRDMQFNYQNSQPNTNTASIPVLFTRTGYEGSFNNISFKGGYTAIKIVSGITAPWGNSWGNLIFGSGLSGSAIDFTGSVTGIPNNHFGRFFITATNMTKTIFIVSGYNFVWDAIEILDARNVQWIAFSSGSACSIGALKCELATYTGTTGFNQNALINAQGSLIDIGQLRIEGTTCTFLFTGTVVALINTTVGRATIKSLSTALTAASTYFCVFAGSGPLSEIGYPVQGTYPIPYTDTSASASADNLMVYPDFNNQVSANKGDADYTVLPGDRALVRFETALTAIRTVNLPVTSAPLFNGLRYRVTSYGAVNGANTILVKAGGNLKATISTDKTFVELVWRRHPTLHLGWLIMDAGTLP